MDIFIISVIAAAFILILMGQKRHPKPRSKGYDAPHPPETSATGNRDETAGDILAPTEPKIKESHLVQSSLAKYQAAIHGEQAKQLADTSRDILDFDADFTAHGAQPNVSSLGTQNMSPLATPKPRCELTLSVEFINCILQTTKRIHPLCNQVIDSLAELNKHPWKDLRTCIVLPGRRLSEIVDQVTSALAATNFKLLPPLPDQPERYLPGVKGQGLVIYPSVQNAGSEDRLQMATAAFSDWYFREWIQPFAPQLYALNTLLLDALPREFPSYLPQEWDNWSSHHRARMTKLSENLEELYLEPLQLELYADWQSLQAKYREDGLAIYPKDMAHPSLQRGFIAAGITRNQIVRYENWCFRNRISGKITGENQLVVYRL